MRWIIFSKFYYSCNSSANRQIYWFFFSIYKSEQFRFTINSFDNFDSWRQVLSKRRLCVNVGRFVWVFDVYRNNNIFFQIFIFNWTVKKWHVDFFEKRSSEFFENEQKNWLKNELKKKMLLLKNENLMKKKRKLIMLKKKWKLIKLKKKHIVGSLRRDELTASIQSFMTDQSFSWWTVFWWC